MPHAQFSIWASATSLIALLASPVSTAGNLPAVGWMPQEFFTEATHLASDAPFHREFYPLMENSDHWSERIVIDQLMPSAGATPQSLMDLQAGSLKEHCREFSEHRYDLPEEVAATTALMFWHCARDDQTNRGIVGMMKVVLAEGRAYIATASGNYAPFAPETTPVLESQVSRWADFLRSFEVCDVLTNPGCAPAADLLLNAPAAIPSAEEQTQVSLAEARGRALFIRDQLAWHATDHVVENNLLKKLKKGGLFLATANADGSGQVYFVQKRKVLRVDMDENFRPIASKWEKAIPDSIAAPLRALKLAIKEADDVCGETINNVVLQAEDGKGWLVYLLGATTQENVIILGRHRRIAVDASGTRIIANDASTRSCLAVGFDRADAERAGSKWMGALVSHLVSQVPWETHVFQSLTFDMPIFVTTDHAAWHVQDGRVIKIDLQTASEPALQNVGNR